MKHFLLSLILIIPILSFSQENSNLPPKDSYKKGVLTTTEFDKYECRDIKITADSINFTDAYSGKYVSVPMSDVGTIKVKAGNYFWLMAGCGAVVFAAGAFSTSPNPVFVGVFTVAGIIAGGVTGFFIPKNKVYRINY